MSELFDPFAHPEHIQRTERSRVIAKLRAIYDGRQYEGRANWWTGLLPGQTSGEEHPLRERAPCIVYRLPKAGVDQVVRFMLGDGRWPMLMVRAERESEQIGEREQDDDETDDGVQKAKPRHKNQILKRMADEGGLNEDEAEALQAWLSDAVEAWKLKPRFRAAAKSAIGCKTGVMVLGMRDGKLHIEQPLAEHCAARFRNDDPYDDVLELIQCYQYDAEITDRDGRPKCARFIYRRQWDADACYEWSPIELKPGESDKSVKWGSPQTVTPHGWSFCPVIWVMNGDGETADGCDGIGLYEGSEDEIEALDFTLSQRHRGLTFYGSPQMVETGVPDGDGPGATGRTSLEVGPDGIMLSGSTVARKMGGSQVWTYEAAEAAVKLVETSGKAYEVASLHARDIRARLLETWSVVIHAIGDGGSSGARTTMGAEMSARFLALAHAPLIGLVAELRHIWWPYGLERMFSMALRMVVELDGRGVLIPGSEEIARMLSRFHSRSGGTVTWRCPRIDPAWGDFFDPSYAEIKESVDATSRAKDAGLICSETAVSATAQAFSIEDVQHELDEIEKEKSQRTKSDADAEIEAVNNLHSRMNDANARTGQARAGRNAPEVTGGRSGTVTAASSGGKAQSADG